MKAQSLGQKSRAAEQSIEKAVPGYNVLGCRAFAECRRGSKMFQEGNWERLCSK
jgi:hypothetical protein